MPQISGPNLQENHSTEIKIEILHGCGVGEAPSIIPSGYLTRVSGVSALNFLAMKQTSMPRTKISFHLCKERQHIKTKGRV
jgi:hypothetical protein